MKAKRRYLTPKERAAMREAQHGMCVCGCDQPLGERTVAEHWICVALGNGEKPDSLLRVECAAKKTVRDIKAIAKVKRLRRKNAPDVSIRVNHSFKLRSRGFDRSLKKKLSGEVVKRDASIRRNSRRASQEIGAGQ